ncbi:VWA domain-containing protein [Pilimelia columellifera]|uniref:Mg-protoporphyrin IX chelatase n=1 Tax=Pilimelia columellifera subsp. columellifera TaxID=706583 RepID=A0ABP6AYL1_9ACTN
MTSPYPFSAVVGLPELRLALLLNAVSPAIGGVLVRGEKGTAKSTIVRAVAALLPQVDIVRGCRFACHPATPDQACPDGPHDPSAASQTRPAALVELPVGATEDRVTGTLDIHRALGDGVKAYEPGLLAAAHRGVLYVDEVNLLPDHLVDLLLDAAAMGRAHVERDGVSIKHAARFLLVGTMNPEEGEPRPQLVDRFGLVVSVTAPQEPAPRAEVVRRRLAYEVDPEGYAARWAEADATLAVRISQARERLPRVSLPDAELDRIARICLDYRVDGLRADIVVARTAVAMAAWHGHTTVAVGDVRAAARLALPHRRRRDPLDPPGADAEKLDEVLDRHAPEHGPEDEPPAGPDDSGPDGGPEDGPSDGPGPSDNGAPDQPPVQREDGARPAPSHGRGPGQDVPEPDPAGSRPPGVDAGEAGAPPDAADPNDPYRRPDAAAAGAAVSMAAPFRPQTLRLRGRGRGGHAGRRSAAFARRGRVVGSRRPVGVLTSLHLTASLRATALRGARTAERTDLREAIHVGRESNLVLFVVDASGSMAARQRMSTVKTAVLSLLRDAYQRRDRIGMITFRGAGAWLDLPPTSSHEVGVVKLAELRTGGRTPLAAGLRLAASTLAAERRRDPRRRPLLVLVTDGRATAGGDPLIAVGELTGVDTVVLDCESGPVRLGLARRLAAALGADCLPLTSLDAASVSTRKAA